MENNIDYDKVFELLDTITGLPLKRKGKRWYGACYFDGSRSDRFDKLTCRVVRDGIQIFEQGNSGMTLFTWMLKHGGCSSKREVYEKLVALNGCNIIVPPPKPEPELKYIYPTILEYEKRNIGKIEDGFFKFLCSAFNRQMAITIYRIYNVTPTTNRENLILTTFWYVDAKGRILHDKSMLYDTISGHRDKGFHGSRRFREDQGYRGFGLFGEHLLAETPSGTRIFVVESEKTAIMATLFFKQGVWLASGGKNCLSRAKVDPSWTIITDIDAWEYWNSIYPGQCPKWWEHYKDWQYGPKDDIGDYITHMLHGTTGR